MTRRSAPLAPSPERRRQLIELTAWHQAWALQRVDTAPFDPAGRKPGSDYNQHFADIDDDDDEFHARAGQIMGLGGSTAARIDSLHVGPDDDDDLDEDTLALIEALSRFDDEDSSRAWDPDKHPRVPPGGPGGGRFLSLVDRLHAAIKEHREGKGAGDPFHGFSREQLRRAAKARGIGLRRGAERDEISKALLDHLGHAGGNAEAKVSGPKGPSVDRILQLGAGNIERHTPAHDELVAMGQQIWGGHFGKDGIEPRVDYVHVPMGGGVSFRGSLMYGGNKVGQFIRTVDRDDRGPHVYHDLLQIKREDLQGQGFAQEFNGHAEDWYREQGFDRIELEADLDVGGYAWARNGYDFSDDDSRAGVQERLEETLAQYRDKVTLTPTDDAKRAELSRQLEAGEAFLRRLQAGERPTAFEFTEIGHEPGLKDWIGRATMLNSETAWTGVKFLR